MWYFSLPKSIGRREKNWSWNFYDFLWYFSLPISSVGRKKKCWNIFVFFVIFFLAKMRFLCNKLVLGLQPSTKQILKWNLFAFYLNLINNKQVNTYFHAKIKKQKQIHWFIFRTKVHYICLTLHSKLFDLRSLILHEIWMVVTCYTRTFGVWTYQYN